MTRFLLRVSFLLAAVPIEAGGEGRLESIPSLAPALQQMKTELGLSDAQVNQAEGLLADQYGRVKAVVDEFGGVSFDSVVDVLAEARSVRDDFIPKLNGVLSEEQRAKLGSLPKAHEIYIAAAGGWLTEAYLDKLGRKVGLSREQLADLRSVTLEHFRDAVSIVEGVIEGGGAKKAVLDAVVDLRGVQRQTRRDVEKRLTDEQKGKLEAFREESDEASLSKGKKGAAEKK